jgi:hypothetical protein
MKTSTRERQRKWRQKQLSSGMQTVTVMLPSEIKDLIDRKREVTGATIGQIVETAVVNLLSPSEGVAANDTKPTSDQKWLNVSAKKMRQMSADLKAMAERIEKRAGVKEIPVTCYEKTVTNNACTVPEVETQDPVTREIYRLVRLLHNMEVRPDEIAATLTKRKFKTLSGAYEWRESDVCTLLQDIQQKYGHINPLFSITGDF